LAVKAISQYYGLLGAGLGVGLTVIGTGLGIGKIGENVTAGIARQPEANMRSLAKRFDAPIRFCVDADGQLARRLGIEHVGGVPFLMEPLGYDPDSVLPTVVITNPARTIIFADLTDNYRVRPEPSTFLAVLDAQG